MAARAMMPIDFISALAQVGICFPERVVRGTIVLEPNEIVTLRCDVALGIDYKKSELIEETRRYRFELIEELAIDQKFDALLNDVHDMADLAREELGLTAKRRKF